MINVLMSRGILGSDMLVEELKNVIKKEHKVAILLYSFFEKQLYNEQDYHAYYEKGSEYYEKMVNSFIPYGIGESQLMWINYFKTSKEEALHILQSADIIYFPGGAPEEMMKRIQEKGLLEAIESHKKIYIGSSAGAMIQMHQYHISKDDDYKAFSYQQGLNLLHGFSIEVHYARKKKQKRGMRKVFRAFRHPIFTIPDDGAIVIDDKQIILLGTANLMYDANGVLRKKRFK